MNSNLSIKPISELLGMNFFIPSYQRGYRWSEQQITDLLKDIQEFNPANEAWYCLQPLVVREMTEEQKEKYSLKSEKDSNIWFEVIDGQQRLTTVFLMIHYFNEMWIGKQKINEPLINYETRTDSYEFLKKIAVGTDDQVEIDDTNIDYWHISNAYDAIHKWVKDKGDFDNNHFQSKFKEKTKVIWYETNEDDAVQIFTRINMGKIRLTNAELIKALFLNSSNFQTNNTVNEDKIRSKQLEIAKEWDFIEYSLHNEEFWWSINKEENKKETRIEFLFELIVGKPTNKEDDTYTFREYAEKFQSKSEKEIEENWKQLKRYFQTLQDWFNDRELYHKIGFLVTLGEDIQFLIEKSQSENKTIFIELIDEKIKNSFSKAQLEGIEYGDGMIRSILLLHNIQTMLNNTKENSRFPFNRYKKEKWDIEHIHANALEAKVKDDFIEQKKWLNDNFEKDDSVHNVEELNARIQSFDHPTGNADENFQDVIDYVLGDEDGSLGNLCLLDRGTNRSYKNDAFKKKRKKIIEQEKNGTFIPICTRNVFMKYYSSELRQLGQWSDADRTAYLENIKEVLKLYLPTQND